MSRAGLRRLVGTVRFRIAALATLAVVLILVVAGMALLSVQRRMLTEDLDDGIVLQAEEIARQARDDQLPTRLTGLGDDDTVAQVVTVDGEVIASSPNVAGMDPVAEPPPAGQERYLRTVHDIPDEDEPYRLVARRVAGVDSPVVYVGANTDDVDESVAALFAALALTAPPVVAVLALVVWWLVGRTLRPVEAIRAEVAQIGGGELHRRVPEPRADDEIGRLARTMNTMLTRVEDATRRQQRFVADASHELRSPLTRMRAALEVDLAHPRSADPLATHRSVLEETVGLQHLVDDLLQLARFDAAGTSGPLLDRAVDLDDVVRRLARTIRADGDVEVDTTAVGAAQATGDAGQIARAVGNVADNAVRHAAELVSFGVVEQDGHAVVTVTDDGPGIPAADHERVFERFTRLDDARATTTGGAGLGLAIAREIVHRHHGTLTIDPDHHPGARLVITLPTPANAE